MTDVKAVFYILYGAMVIDDEVDEREAALLEVFLKDQMIDVDFVVRDELRALMTSETYFLKSLKAAIEHFRSRDVESKKGVLRLVVAMIKIDGKVDDNEIIYLSNIGEEWRINIPAIINELL